MHLTPMADNPRVFVLETSIRPQHVLAFVTLWIQTIPAAEEEPDVQKLLDLRAIDKVTPHWA